MVVGWSWFDVAGLRARNPNGIFLVNPALTTSAGRDAVHVTAPGAAATWTGGTDDQPGGVTLGSIRPVDPAWDLLHNADGSYASVSPNYGRIMGWDLAAPQERGTPNLVAKVFAYAAKKDGLYSRGWDGVHSDNWIYPAIGSSWFYGSNLDSDRDGRVDDAATLRRRWADGLTLLGNNLRSYLPGKIVGGNGAWYRPQDYTGSDPDGWLKASNYTLVENMEAYAYNTPESFLSLTRRWLDYPDPLGRPRYMAVYQDALDSSGSRLPQTSNPNDPTVMLRSDVMKSMRWGLTLSLMTDVYYEITLGGDHATRWWYDEYDGGEGIHQRGYLGKPLGGPIRLANGLYRRNFENGVALNNSSTSAETVALGGAFRKLKGAQNPTLNNGSTVTSVVVPAHDGIILLRTGGSPTPSTTEQVPTSVPQSTQPPTSAGANLAAGRPATASSTRGSAFVAAMAVDGNQATRWSAAWRDGEWWQVDLGSPTKVASVTIDWEDAYASRYLILTSLDGSTFSTAADVTGSGPGPKTTSFTTRDARYVRIVAVTRATQRGTSFYEVQVYGPPTATSSTQPTTTQTTTTATTTTQATTTTTQTTTQPSSSPDSTGSNLAAGRPATASSTRGPAFVAGMAVDGNSSTRWSAAWRDGEWWQVDLGSATKVVKVRIDWEEAYCGHYQVQTSLDGSSFTTAADDGATGAGPRTTSFVDRSARYVRILCLKRGTQYGTSFWEAQVY